MFWSGAVLVSAADEALAQQSGKRYLYKKSVIFVGYMTANRSKSLRI